MGDRKAADREYSRRYRAANREAIRERDRQRYAARAAAKKESDRRHYEANRAAIAEQHKQYYQAHREAHRQAARRWRAANPDAVKASARRNREARRTAVFDHYGWACTCCGTTERLTIDHKNGNGGAHRKELFGTNRRGSTWRLYRWLEVNGFPDDFQTLCMPCNASKRNHPQCRLNHQEAA